MKLLSVVCLILVIATVGCLFDFSYKGTGFPGLSQYKSRINVLAQGHNTVTPMRLKCAAPWSRDKHSTTEPLHSLPPRL